MNRIVTFALGMGEDLAAAAAVIAFGWAVFFGAMALGA